MASLRPTPSELIIDRRTALERVADDEELLQELFDTFLDESSRMEASVKEAFALGDQDALFRAAHTLKGALLAISATPASRVVGFIEQAAKRGHMETCEAQMVALPQALELVRQAIQDSN